MKIVFNSSPLIVLSRLNFLSQFLNSDDDFYLPQSVAEEINAKQDESNAIVQQSITQGLLQVQATQLITLTSSLRQRLGKGEAEAIALSIEINTDFIILDDAAARREAQRLGLTVRGTLAIIRKLHAEQKITINDLNALYLRLVNIGFRVRRSLFNQIFEE